MSQTAAPTGRSTSEPGFDPKEFRRTLGQFATGVTVVTYDLDGAPRGATVNSFTSVSIEPPLVLVSIARSAKAYEALQGKPFTVNVLATEQLGMALRFAGKPDDSPIPWEQGRWAPRITGALAHFECTPWAAYDGGDHVLFLGRVEAYDRSPGEPLAFFAGRFRRMGLLLPDGPRVIPLDGRPFPEYVTHLHRLHEAAERGLDPD